MVFELKAYHKKISQADYLKKLEAGSRNVRFIDGQYIETDVSNPSFKEAQKARLRAKTKRKQEMRAPLVKAIKQLKAENKKLKKDLERLKNPNAVKKEQIKALREKIKALKA